MGCREDKPQEASLVVLGPLLLLFLKERNERLVGLPRARGVPSKKDTHS